MDKEQAKARLREDIEALYTDCAARFFVVSEPNRERFVYIGHGRTECSCGNLLYQCRCPGPRGPTRIVQNVCANCRTKGLVQGVEVSTERLDGIRIPVHSGDDPAGNDQGQASLDEERVREGVSRESVYRDLRGRVLDLLRDAVNALGLDAAKDTPDYELARLIFEWRNQDGRPKPVSLDEFISDMADGIWYQAELRRKLKRMKSASDPTD